VWQLELLRGACDSGRSVALSLEMFERDVQVCRRLSPPLYLQRNIKRNATLSGLGFDASSVGAARAQGVMSEYLAGSIRERDLLRDARPWPNYINDYRPMVELARSRGLPVICANAPRRYVCVGPPPLLLSQSDRVAPQRRPNQCEGESKAHQRRRLE
jgi:hypothetical protein